jgi:hypothetical protein
MQRTDKNTKAITKGNTLSDATLKQISAEKSTNQPENNFCYIFPNTKHEKQK